MNLEIAALWISGASLLLQVVQMIPRDPKKRTPEDEAALLAVSEAYYATKAYDAFLKSNPRDESKEFEVAAKWERVAVLLHKYDSSLGERLSVKSEYWRRGANWSDEAIRVAGIGLEQIKMEVDERLSRTG
jgi:hypothetical protein